MSLAPIAFGKAGDAPATGVATANVSEIVGQSAGARASEPAVVAAPDAREALGERRGVGSWARVVGVCPGMAGGRGARCLGPPPRHTHSGGGRRGAYSD